MMKKLRFLFLVILIFALTSCSQEVIETSKAPDKVTILMNWTIDGQHAPFFVAKEKGFFEEQNIEAEEILRGNGSADTVTKVITGAADFGFAHTQPIIQAVAANQPVKIIMGFYTGELCMLYSTKSGANIQSVEDLAKLENGKFGGPPADICWTTLLAVGDTTGTDLSNIELTNVTADARIALLATGEIDMAGTYYTGVTAFRKGVEQAGEELVTMRYDEYLSVYGNSVIANTILIEQNPDLVQRFVTALLQGLEYTVDNPAEAEQIVLKYQPQLDTEFNHDSLDLMVNSAIWDETTREEGLGIIDSLKMKDTIDTVAKYWEVERIPDVDEVFTNEYILNAHGK